jgi:hypothetical protein
MPAIQLLDHNRDVRFLVSSNVVELKDNGVIFSAIYTRMRLQVFLQFYIQSLFIFGLKSLGFLGIIPPVVTKMLFTRLSGAFFALFLPNAFGFVAPIKVVLSLPFSAFCACLFHHALLCGKMLRFPARKSKPPIVPGSKPGALSN